MKYLFYTLAFIFLGTTSLIGQNNGTSVKRNVVQKAHDKKLKLVDFTATEQKIYKVKVFTTDTLNAKINHTHHWFVQVLDENNQYVNFANIKMDGHLKSNADIKFNYMFNVNRLCNEGKYVIGFVNVKNEGSYLLNFEIDSFGEVDTITAEIEISTEVKMLSTM